ncbi:helix-turn-helix domain-containing protein [Metabacillus idriensis]|uniref:helix-turn-helix domain-containing protein n=1 Tax=Metabacillus idriensis TaxID=324768 RepID=UPI002813EE7C|nr:helix-turn-helix domain-containing protein [Metabacillus idriensis]MDR0139101.1 helix-turn-helix domain-containing protein [Metabacillus idriensis]
MLGERIRNLRKQKKLTLAELAGTELTKGMLSLIENNKANPSMESLAYIAKRLEVDVSQLVNEVNVVELREVLDESEKLYSVNKEDPGDKYEKLIQLIEPHVHKLQQGYEAARLLDLFGRSLYREEKEWKEPIDKAAALYEQMNLTQKRASIGLFRSIVHFIRHHYEKALEVLLLERKMIEERFAYIDPITRLDLDYHQAVFHFAVGSTESAKRVMNDAIAFSKENKTYYLIDDLYRLAAASAQMAEDTELYNYYIMKLKQYAEFSEDEGSWLSYHIFSIESLISVKHDYHSALEIIDSYLEDAESILKFKEWFYLEKGKALHGLGEYEEAVRYLDQAEVPPYHHHPFDLSQFYLVNTYKALCYEKLGYSEKALAAARTAVEQFEAMPDSPYKEFSKKTYDELGGMGG